MVGNSLYDGYFSIRWVLQYTVVTSVYGGYSVFGGYSVYVGTQYMVGTQYTVGTSVYGGHFNIW